MNTDIVIVVAQDRSNFGEVYDGAYRTASDLKNKGMVNRIERYTPRNISPIHNEINKRKIGLMAAKEMGATHFITMDCDEFYFEHQFREAKNKVIQFDFDATAVIVQNYWKDPTYQCIGHIEPFICPFINKIHPHTDFNIIKPYFSEWIDPTRRITTHNSHIIFTPQSIMMHHYTTVRRDIRRKYQNWTARLNLANQEQINRKVYDVLSYDIEDTTNKVLCTVVDNFFGIKL